MPASAILQNISFFRKGKLFLSSVHFIIMEYLFPIHVSTTVLKMPRIMFLHVQRVCPNIINIFLVTTMRI